MRILVLTYFFRPDLSAGSFRATPFVESLSRLAPAGTAIDVITTRPHRYHSFKAQDAAPEHGVHAGASVTRIALPGHKGGFVDQPRSFMSFAYQALRQTADIGYDLVFATSSRLMTAALGARIARAKGARLYLDIRDIFADTMREVLSRKAAAATRPFFEAAERWTIGSADRVNLVSRGFADYFTKRYPRQRFSYITNGVDDEFTDVARTMGRSPRDESAPLTILYAGNMGAGQGLDVIVPALAARMGHSCRFILIGEGAHRPALLAALAAAGVNNVEVHGPMQRDALLRAYGQADVLFLHLNDFEAFKKVLPSKVFEYGALGKPVLAGVAGYAAEFIRSEISNAAVFEPCDVEGAITAFRKLELRDTPRPEFVERFSRRKVSDALAADVLDLLAAPQ